MSVGLQAVLWDMDGTLIDSEPTWFEVQARIVNATGGSWTPEDAAKLTGADLRTTVIAMRDAGSRMPPDEMAEQLTRMVVDALTRSVTWRPGAHELVMELASAGVRQAIVTTSTTAMTRGVLDALPPGTMHAVVTADTVTLEKPHPEPYLRAAALMQVDIGRCVAVEDSRVGLTAAIASGARVVGVPSSLPLEESPAWTNWDTLRGRGLTDVFGLFGGP